MKFFLTILMLSTLVSCERQEEKGVKKYFDLQIQTRIQIISGLPVNDSLRKSVYQVHKRVGELTLLSKDVENLQASVHLANAFFIKVAKENNLNPSDFRQLSLDMHADHIETTLHQNELNFLNQVIFRADSGGIHLYTAQ